MTGKPFDQAGAGMPLNRNARTGLILAAVALVFFAAVIVKYWLIR